MPRLDKAIEGILIEAECISRAQMTSGSYYDELRVTTILVERHLQELGSTIVQTSEAKTLRPSPLIAIDRDTGCYNIGT